MIHLTKQPEPRDLADNSEQWTNTLLQKLAAGIEPTQTDKTRYRRPSIKAALVLETSGKCAYCESRLLHIHHGDVEHIYPKSLDPARTFEWENLTLACEVCNQNKSNLDPNLEHILDPYNSDPESHFIYLGGLVFARPTVEGNSTLSILDLQRAELVEMRNDQAERIMSIFSKVIDITLPLPARQAIYDNLKSRELSSAAPYTAMARHILRTLKNDIPDDLIP